MYGRPSNKNQTDKTEDEVDKENMIVFVKPISTGFDDEESKTEESKTETSPESLKKAKPNVIEEKETNVPTKQLDEDKAPKRQFEPALTEITEVSEQIEEQPVQPTESSLAGHGTNMEV